MLLPLIHIGSYFHRFVDHFLLAEAGYLKELKLKHSLVTVLENKTIPITEIKTHKPWTKGDRLKLIFTGSISDYSGVMNAIKVYVKIKQIYADVSLSIVGSCIDNKLQDVLNQLSIDDSNIELFIDKEHLPHDTIIQSMEQADLAIIGYLPNKTNQNRIPTKLYEYCAYRLPYVIHDHYTWQAKSHELGGGIVLDLVLFDPNDLLTKLQNIPESRPHLAIWKDESTQLMTIIKNLIQHN